MVHFYRNVFSHVPSTRVREVSHMLKAIHAQEQKRGRAPTEGEIAEELQLPLASYQHLLQEIHGCQLVHYEDFDRGDQENSFID